MSRRGPWWKPRSLRRQLMVGVTTIVSVALIGVGVVAVMSLRDEAIRLTDSKVSDSLAAFSYSYIKRDTAGVATGELTAFQGQALGTVIAVLRGDSVVYATVFGDGEPKAAPADAQRALEGLDLRDGAMRTVELGDLGPYRVGSRELASGERLVSAVSLDHANKTLSRETVIVIVLVLLALVGTAAGTVWIVSYALRPLRRVAEVAGEVAALPLTSQEHRITARVAESDTDPGNEVGIVGNTLNRLLVNVDGALADLADSDRRMRQFLADASHELRSPLAAILGYAELTRQDSDALPETTEYALARIEAESRRMTSLVADLLLLSRLDERQDLDIADIEMCDLVADAVQDAAVTAPDHHFVVDLPDEPLWARGDREGLHQLLANLLANARVHTPAGVTVTTTLRARAQDGRQTVELTVSDDGPGIPPAVLPNLFDRFVRADKSRSRQLGSTGLGLSIVRSIVEAHNGTVSVASVPGRTAFTVRLPASGPTG
ncbi:MAG: HAMP domain-containing protein [Mycobacterium sp.]|nr:HAMP domain-containing protein [Mycobacterium sp.]